MTPVIITARDGLPLPAYLTRPQNTDNSAKSSPAPLVLLIHGGPWDRDRWGFEPRHQWLANRGYAVLSVNYRGSTGFGRSFLNAGFGQWGDKMQQDLEDATHWAIAQHIAAPDRVCLYGGSYGGFAALSGMMHNPELFACCISKAAPVDLIKMLEQIPPYWEWGRSFFRKAVGDIHDAANREKLARQSPTNNADKFLKPVLIAIGANDARVRKADADNFVAALKHNKTPVSYVVFTNEGHSFTRADNANTFFALVEQFLSQHLGGNSEPPGKELSNAAVIMPSGGHILSSINNEDLNINAST